MDKIIIRSEQGVLHIILILLILALILGGGYIFFTNQGKEFLENLSPKKEAPLREISLEKEAQVNITDKGFIPEVITIKKGTQVTWVNTDSASSHQVASDPHPMHTTLENLDSKEPLEKNDSYSFIFEKVGKYTYHDHLNPFKFKGAVIVE